MVDEGRIARLLRSLTDRVARLREAASRPAPDRDDLWLDAVKYLFITAIECCVDVSQHISASEGFPAPDSNAAAVRTLGDRGVIDADLAHSIARAVGFRNVLVHRYIEVDDGVVVAALDRLGELDQFVHEVSRWVVGLGNSETLRPEA